MTVKITPILYDTYLALIKNSVGAGIFRNSYARINGKKADILRDGKLSCAFFVSSVLVLFKLIRKIHATVEGTIKDLEKSGWRKIKKPKIGSVLIWETVDFGKGDFHKHIGFYIGKKKAISNSRETQCPQIHHWTFGTVMGKPRRRVDAIYWNSSAFRFDYF